MLIFDLLIYEKVQSIYLRISEMKELFLHFRSRFDPWTALCFESSSQNAVEVPILS